MPIGVLGIILVTRFIPDLREEQSPPLDLLGFLLSAVGLVGLVFGFETIGGPRALEHDVPAAGRRHHRRRALCPAREPHALSGDRPRPARHPDFRASVLAASCSVSASGLPFLLPLMLQVGFGLSPLNSGLLTFAAAAGAMLMKLTAGPNPRAGFRPANRCPGAG